MNCEKAREELSLFLYGELGFQEEEELERHLDSCEGCRAALEREKALQSALDLTDMPVSPVALGECRRALRSRLRSEAEVAGAGGFWRRLARLDFGMAWMRPAGAVALLAIGFFSARLMTPAAPALPAAKATRVRSVEPDQNGVRITVEETRDRTVQGPLGDDHIRQLLLSAAMDPADPDLRVESIDLLKNRPEEQGVRQALMQAVVADPNPGVRLKALEGLKPFAGDSEVRQTLTQILLRDENAGLRTQAIDLLIQHKQRDMVGVLQQLMQFEDNDYIRNRCQRTLLEMNASVESF